MAKILIIDDDETLRELLEMVLQIEGYEVATARNGEEGVRMASESAYDLVFVDLLMPVMDGVVCIEKLGETLDPCPPLMVFSGSRVPGQEKELLDQPAVVGVLQKPVAPDDILARVREIIG